jgi:hypothetical protein
MMKDRRINVDRCGAYIYHAWFSEKAKNFGVHTSFWKTPNGGIVEVTEVSPKKRQYTGWTDAVYVGCVTVWSHPGQIGDTVSC